MIKKFTGVAVLALALSFMVTGYAEANSFDAPKPGVSGFKPVKPSFPTKPIGVKLPVKPTPSFPVGIKLPPKPVKPPVIVGIALPPKPVKPPVIVGIKLPPKPTFPVGIKVPPKPIGIKFPPKPIGIPYPPKPYPPKPIGIKWPKPKWPKPIGIKYPPKYPCPPIVIIPPWVEPPISFVVIEKMQPLPVAVNMEVEAYDLSCRLPENGTAQDLVGVDALLTRTGPGTFQVEGTSYGSDGSQNALNMPAVGTMTEDLNLSLDEGDQIFLEKVGDQELAGFLNGTIQLLGRRDQRGLLCTLLPHQQ